MSRRVLLLLIAGVIAAFTAVSVRNRLSEAPVEVAAPVANHVVVSKHDLTPGSFVQPAQDLDWGPAPAVTPPAGPDMPAAADSALLHEGSVQLSDFNGAVVRKSIHAGDPIPASALMKSGEGGFMSAVLEPGKRAVSIAVNATSGNAGFVSPGDHIDLIVTHRYKVNNGAESVISETFVHNVRVVAVDQMLDNPDNKAILAKTVTVEVSPREAEQVSVAAEMGKISVALRSLSNAPAKAADGEEAPQMTDLYGNSTDSDGGKIQSANIPHVQVIRGDKAENIEFYKDTAQ